MHPLQKYLAEHEITQEAFAKAIGKEQSYVSMLLHRVTKKKRPVPSDICPAIERATEGKITAHQLRPDVFGSEQGRAA